MKKLKMTLAGLKVESFITNTTRVRGGAGMETSHGADICGTDDVGCIVTVHDRPTHKEGCRQY
jgi:hypothetical protein